ATDAVVRSGATADSVEIQIEIDAQAQKVRAIATGTTEIATQDLARLVDEDEARRLAAESMGVESREVKLIEANEHFWVFGRQVKDKQEIRVVNKKGFIQRQREDGTAAAT